MNCLLCKFVGSSTAELHKHYVLYHRINPDNYFFLEVFKDENGWLCKECIRCNEFLITKKKTWLSIILKILCRWQRKAC